MPQKVIKFKGINRNLNAFQCSGECDELINLRPSLHGAHHSVKQKRVIVPNVHYKKTLEHTWGDTHNHVVVYESGLIMWLDSNFMRESLLTREFIGKDVEFSYAGNTLVIYCKEERKQLVFKFKDDKYVEYKGVSSLIKDISVACTFTGKEVNGVQPEGFTIDEFNVAMHKAASSFYGTYPNGLCGASVVGCTYELEDGTEFWSTGFIVVSSTRCAGHHKPDFSGFAGPDGVLGRVCVMGASSVSVNLVLNDIDTSDVKKINIYASRPVFPYEITGIEDTVTVNELTLEKCNLAGNLMYYQGSVEPNVKSASVPLNFNMSQSGERIMDVTAGCIERTGSIVSYNNRFHYYDSDVYHVMQFPTISNGATGSINSYWIAYVNFEGKWKLIDKTYLFSESQTHDFIYPLSGIKKVAFVRAEQGSGGEITVPYNDMFVVEMKDSSAYNYSYAFDVKPNIVSARAFYEEVEDAGQIWGIDAEEKVFYKKEPNAINVSAMFNPFAFPVKYSYSFSGGILDISTSYTPISAVQAGQYPLNVFTSLGIFALEQGSGDSLYERIVPLQPLAISGKAMSTPYGTFFTSSNLLYMLTGRDSKDVSYSMDGHRELKIRELPEYQKLCCSSSGFLYDFSELLSKIEFKDYLSDATLTYDQLNDEIIISSNRNDIAYSYVLNIGSLSYHKIDRKYVGTNSGARFVMETHGGVRNIVDLHTEDDGTQTILLQSRPMSFDVLYTHIQRLMMFVDANLVDNQYLLLSVFASDNLHDWKCVISAQKAGVVLRQIRANKAGKSYKDYIILINGRLSTDADLADIIVDYTTVNRRLG